MTAMKKRTLSLLVVVPVLLVALLGQTLWKAEEAARFMSHFQALQDGKSKLTTAQVEGLMGQPLHIEHAEATGITGDAYHYPTYPPGGDLKVVFVNGVLHHTEISTSKNS